jgi:hypothetical protein
VTARECDAPKPFELCLDLEGDSGKRRYYSRHDWVIEPGEAVDTAFEDAPELVGRVIRPSMAPRDD